MKLEVIVLVVCLISLSKAAPQWRVVNGQEATPNEFPSIVTIQYNGQHFCGGTLLDANTVLTAAHCLFPFLSQGPHYFAVRAGEHYFHQRTGREREVRVARWVMHPNYRSQDHYIRGDDIAILKLAGNIAEESHIRYANLPPTGRDTVRANEICTVAGWGSVNPNGRVPAVKLQKAHLYVYDNQECAHYFYNVGINGNLNICAGRYQEQIGSCSGDSGGPLYCNVQGVQYVMGIVSYGSMPCTQSYVPVVYTRVSTYGNWIAANRR